MVWIETSLVVAKVRNLVTLFHHSNEAFLLFRRFRLGKIGTNMQIEFHF
jgi:hypothetical protein